MKRLFVGTVRKVILGPSDEVSRGKEQLRKKN